MKLHHCISSNKIPQLEVLERRLPSDHRAMEMVKSSIRKELAGIKGQNALEFPLKVSHYNSSPFILFNPRLQDDNGFFEMDILILTRHFFLLLEVKNWYGTLYFDGERQVIRVGDEMVEEGMSNPFSQMKLQRSRFQRWLENQTDLGPVAVPLYNYVTISFPTTITKTLNNSSMLPPELIYSNEVPSLLERLNRAHTEPTLSAEQLHELQSRILHQHIPATINSMDSLNIDPSELIPGVFCPSCGILPMSRVYNNWLCEYCETKSPTAHLQALHDYRTLINSDVSSSEAARFLRIRSRYTARRLLEAEYESSLISGRRKLYNLNARPSQVDRRT